VTEIEQTSLGDTYKVDYKHFGEIRWELFKTGRLHREGDKPALIYPNGEMRWYHNGFLHRINGPAIILGNGTKQYWISNHRYDNAEEYLHRLKLSEDLGSDEVLDWKKCIENGVVDKDDTEALTGLI